MSDEALDRLREEDEALARMPSPFQLARNFARVMWRSWGAVARGEKALLRLEDAAARTEACFRCEKLSDPTASRPRCTACGCFILYKAQFRAATCPLDRWPVNDECRDAE